MARLYPTRGLTALVAVLGLGACEAAKSANPTAPSVAGPIPGVSITAPRPLEPLAGETLTFSSEPPSLLIENAGTSGVRTLWLMLDVSTDTGFSHMVHQANQITPGDNGRTTYRLPEPLGAGYTYYWRTRASDGANTGPFSDISSFNVVPPVVIDTPAPMEPQGDISTNKPNFIARNATISGTTGVVYRFLVATNAQLTNVVGVLTVPPGSNGRTQVSIGELPYNTTFYWRVWGTDGSKESAPSQVISFQASSGERFYMSYRFPEKQKVGINEFEVIAFTSIDGKFVAAENLTMKLTPEMPSMDHGSPNNEDPVHVAKGHYKGKANFTMTGEWRLQLELATESSVLDKKYFDIVVK